MKIVFFFMLNLTFLKAQEFKPLEIRYRFLPSSCVSNSEIQRLENVEISSQNWVEFNARYPIRLGEEKPIIIPQLSYKTVQQGFEAWGGTVQEPGDANLTRLSLSGFFPVNQKWNLLGGIIISHGIDTDANWDFSNTYYGVNAGFLIKNKKGNSIGLSILYAEEVGFPSPLFLFYGASKNDKWHYNITFPAYSLIEYSLNHSWKLRFEQQINNDRFVLDESTADNYNQFVLNLGAGISHKLAKNTYLSIDGGVVPIQRYTFFNGRTDEIGTVSFNVQPTLNASIYIGIMSGNDN